MQSRNLKSDPTSEKTKRFHAQSHSLNSNQGRQGNPSCDSENPSGMVKARDDFQRKFRSFNFRKMVRVVSTFQ